MKINHPLDIYEKPFDIISTEYKTASDIMKDCVYILDTNVLLLPYTISSKELNIIETVYERLVNTNRLLVPEQVIKEFAKNRPNKLCEMHKVISDYLSTLKIKDLPDYRLILDTKEYKNALKSLDEAKDSLNKYQNDIRELLELIKCFNWNDPVSAIYRKIFKANTILAYSYEFESLKKELENRHSYNLPPAFKDKSKDDAGIGDYIIWKSIMEAGLECKKDIIFVTGDEKADWFHQSNNSKLYPRYELLYEFNQYTKGYHIAFISLSTLLEENNMSPESVEAIRDIKISEINFNNRSRFALIKAKLHNRANNKCELCGMDLAPNLALVHHVKPNMMGGNEEIDNLMLLCPNCHMQIDSKRNNDFHIGSPCEMSGQSCPSCHIGILDVYDCGVRCNKCGVFFPSE